MRDRPPAGGGGWVFDVFGHGELFLLASHSLILRSAQISGRRGAGEGTGTYIMIILLHSHNPRNIVECHRAEAEIGIIGDFAHFFSEAVEVWCWDAVYGGDEVGWCEAVLVGRRAATLLKLVHICL